MNNLPIEKKVQIINLLIEGNSLRDTSRIADVSINTVTKLLVDVGTACQQFHHNTVIKINSERVQCHEVWSFCYTTQKNVTLDTPDGSDDIWTWNAIDADTKLIISWFVGGREVNSAYEFMIDVANRLKNTVQLTTDGNRAYLTAVKSASDNDIDYEQLIKMYGGSGGSSDQEKKHYPAECTGAKNTKVSGDPNPKFFSSYVERQNLTMRMHTRRFTGLTNAFSQKIEKYCYAIALHFVYYNFTKIHKSVSVTPAMQAGLTKRVMTLEDIVNLVPYESPKKRRNYKKREKFSD